MPKRVREIIQLIERDGWVYSHTAGSHRHFRHPTKPGLVTVAGADHVEVPKGTEANIRRQAGLK